MIYFVFITALKLSYADVVKKNVPTKDKEATCAATKRDIGDCKNQSDHNKISESISKVKNIVASHDDHEHVAKIACQDVASVAKSKVSASPSVVSKLANKNPQDLLALRLKSL